MAKKLLEVNYGASTLSFPLNWQSVTLRQFEGLRMAENSFLATVLVLADKPELIDDIPDPRADVRIYNLLTFLETPLDVASLPVPQAVNIGGIWADIPQDLGLETFGQKRAVDALFATLADRNDYLSIVDSLIVIYLFPRLANKPFRATEDLSTYLKQVREMPVTEALALAGFFLTSCFNLKPFGTVSYKAKGRKTWNWLRLKVWFRKWLHLGSTD